MKKAIRDQAEKLIRDYGDNAYDKAYEAVRTARRHRNGRLERFFWKRWQGKLRGLPTSREAVIGAN
jgi:hypothetical protein